MKDLLKVYGNGFIGRPSQAEGSAKSASVNVAGI
jgi:hypothetical protein